MSLSKLDTETIVRAFEVMGAYLRDRNLIGEIAVYGGTAILLQFPWRTATDDVDAVFSSGEAEASMKDAAAYAATLLRLPDDWLNNAVGGFTPESESDDFFLLQGDYPRGDRPGLKVFMAKPEYLCAMKLKALTRASFADKDFNDLVELASTAGIEDAEQLMDLFFRFYPDEELDPVAKARIPEAIEAIRRRRPR